MCPANPKNFNVDNVRVVKVRAPRLRPAIASTRTAGFACMPGWTTVLNVCVERGRRGFDSRCCCRVGKHQASQVE